MEYLNSLYEGEKVLVGGWENIRCEKIDKILSKQIKINGKKYSKKTGMGVQGNYDCIIQPNDIENILRYILEELHNEPLESQASKNIILFLDNFLKNRLPTKFRTFLYVEPNLPKGWVMGRRGPRQLGVYDG